MEIVLVPGFWLTADAWREVTPVIEKAGHRAHPLTLPGMESRESDRRAIGVREHVEAIVRSIDEVGDPSARDVVLVGHSGAGPLSYAAVAERPDRIARVVYVDSWPLGPGGVVAADLTPVDGEVPLPEWDDLEDADLVDLTDEQRASFREIAVPSPGAVVTGPIELKDDDRRRAVPATVVACEFTPADLRTWIDGGSPVFAELGTLERWDVVELSTGHWPMFTRPAELGALLVQLAER
jgi:pimeloyl-ACP methyl ester carboxylesterase